jgi:hypothetical protein
MKVQTICVAVLVLSGCRRAQEVDREAPPATNEVRPVPPPPPGTGPNARTPLAPVEPPEPAIDLKSPAAAREVVREYVRLIGAGRSAQADALWSDPRASKRFRERFRDSYIETSAPSDPEGAAGSIFVTVPATIYDNDLANSPVRKRGEVILRRVNDLTGSTESQRRWHIERVDWTGG